MGNDSFHIDKANRNLGFFTSSNLDSTSFPEWAVVVLFYECLHYIDAVLWKDTSLPIDCRNPCDHWHRKRAISNCSRLSAIAPVYLTLYDRSLDSRYTKLEISSSDYGKIKTRIAEPLRVALKGLLGIK